MIMAARKPLVKTGSRVLDQHRLGLAVAKFGGDDVGPGLAIGAYRAYGRCGGERQGGADVRGGQGQGPFLAVRDAACMTVSHGEQALGLGIILWPVIDPPDGEMSYAKGDIRSCPGRCVPAALRSGTSLIRLLNVVGLTASPVDA